MNITEYAGEARIADLELAERLGFSYIYRIRDLIERNRKALEWFGELLTTAVKTSAVGGRPGKTYLLNRKQALYVCAKSETPRAAEVTIAMVELFDGWLEGKQVPVRQHWRRRPAQPQPQLPTQGLQIEPINGTVRRLTVIADDRVCLRLAWAYCDAVAV